jgi:hypothetical protein
VRSRTSRSKAADAAGPAPAHEVRSGTGAASARGPAERSGDVAEQSGDVEAAPLAGIEPAASAEPVDSSQLSGLAPASGVGPASGTELGAGDADQLSGDQAPAAIDSAQPADGPAEQTLADKPAVAGSDRVAKTRTARRRPIEAEQLTIDGDDQVPVTAPVDNALGRRATDDGTATELAAADVPTEPKKPIKAARSQKVAASVIPAQSGSPEIGDDVIAARRPEPSEATTVADDDAASLTDVEPVDDVPTTTTSHEPITADTPATTTAHEPITGDTPTAVTADEPVAAGNTTTPHEPVTGDTPMAVTADEPVAAEDTTTPHEVTNDDATAVTVEESVAEVEALGGATVPVAGETPVPDALARSDGDASRAIGRARVPVQSRGVAGAAGRTVGIWSVVRAQPRLAPAALAVAAVERFAGSARDEADWLRRTYPGVEPARLAREAVRAAGRRSRYATGAALIGGPIGAAAGVSALTWAHARLVLDIAAAFGHDPGDPARAIEVLVLLGAYPDAGTARSAVSELLGDQDVDAPIDDGHRTAASMRATVSARLAGRLAGRLVPGTTAVLDAFRTAADTERLAHRVIRYYRGISRRQVL